MDDSGNQESLKAPWAKLIEKTVGAVRYVAGKHGLDGYIPVGFSVCFYNPDKDEGQERWRYDIRTLIDSHEPPDFANPKIKERINLVNEFAATVIKKILEGAIDDMMLNQEEFEKGVFQIPGMKGTVQ